MHIQANSSAGPAVPIQQRAIEGFAHILEERTGYWWYGQIPPLREVAERTRRIEHADLRYPIILAADGSVLDGRHRIAKAWMLGHPTIGVVQFAPNPEPDAWLDPATVGLAESTVNIYF
jgi:hypothetical protein